MKKWIFFIITGMLLVSLASVMAINDSNGNNGMIVGNDSDEHGCKASAGYSWCGEREECIKSWETNCTELELKDKVKTNMNLTSLKENNKTIDMALMSNGKNAMIKVMPETASATAIARLSIKVCNVSNNCTIELKEVGNGNQTRAAYEIKAEKEVKVLGFIKTRMKVSAQVDAESGNVTSMKKPKWAFLAKEE
jgi:hypothetical protein